MALPRINVWSCDVNNIYLIWQATQKSTIAYWNLYGCSTYGGVYTKMIGNISNDEAPLTPGSVLTQVNRTKFSIATTQPWFFKITSVTTGGVESTLSASTAYAVDALDAVYRERWTDDDSPVYKNIVVSTSGTNFLVDVHDQLGRDANFIQVSTTATVTMAINSQYNDTVTITSAAPFLLPRHALRVDSLYFNGSATVTIFVSGN